MPKKKIKNLSIVSGFFLITYPDSGDESLRCRMRLSYNKVDGIQVYISKHGNDWILHSHPVTGEVPETDLKKFVELFKRSIAKFNPKITFKRSIDAI